MAATQKDQAERRSSSPRRRTYMDGLSTDFLRYWEERILAVTMTDDAEIAQREQPTAGQIMSREIQMRQLTAIRRELTRREHANES